MIPGVPSIGGMELLILLSILVLFFGAKRVPELGRSLGRGMRELRKGASEKHDNEDERRESADGKELPRQEEEEEVPRRQEESVFRHQSSRYRDS